LVENIGNELEKKHCLYEIYFNDFTFEKDEIIPKYTINDVSYPELSLFDDDFEYIKLRANSKKYLNSKFRAKYNHLLWKGPKKHIDFAKASIDN